MYENATETGTLTDVMCDDIIAEIERSYQEILLFLEQIDMSDKLDNFYHSLEAL